MEFKITKTKDRRVNTSEEVEIIFSDKELATISTLLTHDAPFDNKLKVELERKLLRNFTHNELLDIISGVAINDQLEASKHIVFKNVIKEYSIEKKTQRSLLRHLLKQLIYSYELINTVIIFLEEQEEVIKQFKLDTNLAQKLRGIVFTHGKKIENNVESEDSE